MDNAKQFIAKVLTTWVAIGAALLTLSTTGLITVPDVFLELFSQNIADVVGAAFTAIFNAVSAAIVAFQAIRGIFATKETETAPEAVAKALSAESAGFFSPKRKFALNPFKLTLAA